MSGTVKNLSASVQARLRNEAGRQGVPVAEILQYYALERFLFRLSRTEYASKFILKGGLLFYVWNIPMRRPTRDIDFRGYTASDSAGLLQILRDILVVAVPGDGITFDTGTITVEETQIDVDYPGIRARLTAHLGRSKIPVQIDIGFSDEIASKAESVAYPRILSDTGPIRLKGYPKESVVAEKFHAMVRYAELNSRMKDYYDIWLISEMFEFDGHALQKAVETTFRKRNTDLPFGRPVGLSLGYASTNQKRWVNFLKKMGLRTPESDDFTRIVERLWEFISSPLQASAGRTKLGCHWTPKAGWK